MLKRTINEEKRVRGERALLPAFPLVPVIVGYILVVVTLHTMPTGSVAVGGGGGTDSIQLTDLLHIGMFLPWGFLGIRFIYRRLDGRILRAVVWTAAGLLLAVIAEGFQHWLPYRVFKVSDIAMNTSGVILGTMAAVCWRATFARNDR